MMNVFLFSIISFGITTIITQSKIFKWLRDWTESINEYWSSVFRCPLCCGFWCGIFLSVVLFSPTATFIGGNVLITTFFDGCFSAGIVILLDHLRYKLNPDW